MDYKVFRQLLKRYLDNSCTEEERRVVDQWYELLSSEWQPAGDKDLMDIEDRIWSKIQSQTTLHPPVRHLRQKRLQYWLIAASVVGAILAISLFFSGNKAKNSQKPTLAAVPVPADRLQQENKTGEIKTVTLEEGSSVQLYPGAKLSYPKKFAPNKREVYLEGDAFFSVTKNPKRPFYVYNKEIITQVLGTSFRVSGRNGRIEVDVKSGKVAVYENHDILSLNESEQKSNGVIITPNQKVTYYQEERHFVTSIVETPLPVSNEQESRPPVSNFSYNESPLYKVLKDMETTYELEIILENEKIKNCLFTGDLTGENLFNKLEGICLVFGASYELKGTKILLKGGTECTN